MSRHRWTGIALLVAALGAAGCTKSEPPKPVKIAGKVQHANGKPITGMVLSFHPRDEINKGNMPIVALEGKDGRFEVECLPGKYKVTMTPIPSNPGAWYGVQLPPAKEPEKGKEKPAPNPLNNYRSPETTPWEIAVLAEGTPEQTLVVR